MKELTKITIAELHDTALNPWGEFPPTFHIQH
jgi:hypothetical protein